jgi:hypothetical protein
MSHGYRTASGSERDKDATKVRIVLRMLNPYSAPYRSRFCIPASPLRFLGFAPLTPGFTLPPAPQAG